MESPTVQVQDVHPGGLGHGIRRVTGHIPDQHSPLFAELDINIVNARSGFAHEFELGSGIQESLVHDHFVEDGHIGVLYPLPGFLCRRGLITGKLAQGGDFFQGGISHGNGI